MPTIRVVTWNIYHGTINGQTPLNRFTGIRDFGIANNVDIIALQEVPNNALINFAANANPPHINHYVALTHRGEYDQRCYAPNRTLPPPTGRSSDGYVILYNPQTITPQQPATQFFRPDMFQTPGGMASMRPPIGIDFSTPNPNSITFQFYTWHAETSSGGLSQDSVRLLDYIFSLQPPPYFIIAGDLNVRETFLDDPDLFPNSWALSVQVNNRINGLDHIITNGSNAVFQNIGGIDNHQSDGYHYAICADVTLP